MKNKLKVGDLTTVYHLWNRGGLKPAKILKIFSGNQAIVVMADGRKYKVAIGQCGEPLTETEYFKFILMHGS